MLLKGTLICQNDVFLAFFKNKRTKSNHAYILNQTDCQKSGRLYPETEYLFEVVTLHRPMSHKHDNYHVVAKHNKDYFNLLGTNGNVDEGKELLKYKYIPAVVKFIL